MKFFLLFPHVPDVVKKHRNIVQFFSLQRLGFVFFVNKLVTAVNIISASAFCSTSSVYQKCFLVTLTIN